MSFKEFSSAQDGPAKVKPDTAAGNKPADKPVTGPGAAPTSATPAPKS